MGCLCVVVVGMWVVGVESWGAAALWRSGEVLVSGGGFKGETVLFRQPKRERQRRQKLPDQPARTLPA